jgi:endonuclease YncB( thermonuclease family)
MFVAAVLGGIATAGAGADRPAPLVADRADCVAHRGWTPARVVDGDTVAYWPVPALPAPLDAHPLSVRVRGVDCPESGARARCAWEAERGAAATQRAAEFLAGDATAVVTVCGWDKYGGRVLGDVVRLDGLRLSAALLVDGLCEPYNGRGARRAWCSSETTL